MLAKIMRFAVREGRLTLLIKCFLSLTGFGTIYLSLIYSPNMIVLTIGLCIGFALVSLVAYSNKAESLNLPAPFVSFSDPLGWRKAKESYKIKKSDLDEKAGKP